MDQTRDRLVPLALLALGVGGLGPVIYILSGGAPARGMLLGSLIYLLVSTVLGIVALLVVRQMRGVFFGMLGTAALKVAGTFAFTLVLNMVVAPLGCMGAVVTLVVFLGLLCNTCSSLSRRI